MDAQGWAILAVAGSAVWLLGALVVELVRELRGSDQTKQATPRPVVDLPPQRPAGPHGLRGVFETVADRGLEVLLLLVAVAAFLTVLQGLFTSFPADLAHAYRHNGAGAAIGTVLGQLIVPAIPTALLLAWRRRRARARSMAVSTAVPGSVIYLRAFEDDERAAGTRWMPRMLPRPSQEEQLMQALADVGPVVAIGNPRETMPQLGALRLRLSDSTWQPDLLRFLVDAKLVVMRVPVVVSGGVQWELQQVLEGPHRAKTLLMLPNSRRAVVSFNRLIAGRGVQPLPVPSLGQRLLGPRTLGFCAIRGDGTAHFHALRQPSFFRRSWWQPDLPGLRHTLQPLLAERGVALRGARLRWGRIAWVALLAAVQFLMLWGLAAAVLG